MRTERALCSRHQKAEKLCSFWKEWVQKGRLAEAEALKKKVEALAGSDCSAGAAWTSFI